MTELQEYNFQLIHKLSSSQKKVDALSQRPDHTQGKDNNADQILLKGEWSRSIKTQEGKFWKKIEEVEEFIEEEVREAMEQQEKGWRRKKKALLWKKRIYILDSATLWEKVITKHHNSELAGHPGYAKTYELITRNYWWPRILKDVKWYIAGCEKCQATKSNQQPKWNHLHPNKIPQNPWEIISINSIGLLLDLAGYNGILVIVDCFSKIAHYIPININITTQGIAKISWDQVFKDIGIPQKVISDQGPQFVLRFMKELCSQLEIERNPSTFPNWWSSRASQSRTRTIPLTLL